MGVTIHFEGQLKNVAAYQELLEEVSSIAKAEGWSSEAIESRVTTLSRVRDEQNGASYDGWPRGNLAVSGRGVDALEKGDPLRDRGLAYELSD